MTKVTKTYLSGCIWCHGSGAVINKQYSTSLFENCPVCNGSKVITVTEEYDAVYQISTELTPLLDTASLRSMRDTLKRDIEGSGQVLIDALGVTRKPTLMKARRNLQRLSLRDVAEQTGLSISTISRIENGKRCMDDTYRTLLNFWNDYGKNEI